MVKITPDPPKQSSTAPIFDKAVVKRAMACYLPIPRTDKEPHDSKFDFISLEATLVHALDFLRCASATAHELGDELTGAQRDLAFASMHMLEMAKVMVERSLECVEEV
ncbi:MULTISPECIES: DUF6124 family protein [Pseudomonas]|uniref:DUF3077 domain-containing protein n=6 Tax=Pseudomonas syringae group TaxID=136849 RepID=A0AAX1VNA3_PSEAJ|nr:MULTISPECIES: hypothetical protein [Pseudomonas syringae group]KPW69323.1 Uncharacterized protein ALO82_02040 [Pseudomonas syringae pv. broussonetiae]KPX73969.1 Uncharacterized protein ALO35_02048 [Pseudomonas amygdali pv. lachrymans]KEZ27217.1 hypothetical protein A3SK_0111295 [Pseudomonas amygdali pv. tabaci str. 6605]KIY16379.1 hypothetical protein RD00_20880 [Pseudomonas amygdali pv. tabaci]KPX93755.1 Uncharacterized protein ALO63_02654 [Pseudomonas amygdali pv. mori]